MRVALYDVDSKIPNLALMKLAAHHKSRGDTVEPYSPLEKHLYDKIYASKIFNFSDGSMLDPGMMDIACTGWDISKGVDARLHTLQLPAQHWFHHAGLSAALFFLCCTRKRGTAQDRINH